MGESLCDRFALEGFDCDWYQTGHAARSHLGRDPYDALISDIRLPDVNGGSLYRQLLEEGRRLPPTIFITGYGSIGDAVELLKQGAADYVTKPFDLDTLVAKVRAVCRDRPTAVGAGPSLGISAALREVERTLRQVAGHDAAVLITGESGVGKEHAARYLHRCAFGEGEHPFVAVNCGAIPEGLMESELFGHERGAFTGAIRTKRGVFEQADGGTLFLDEIGEMPAAMQVRLLRVIQDRQVVRVGGESVIPVRLRLICATNRDLRRLVAEGGFREDLYYRIHVVHVQIPPLRERREDILWFARLFLQEAVPAGPFHLLPSAEEWLLRQDWPGNLRELHHAIERTRILASGPGIGAAAFGDVGAEPPTELRERADLKERVSHYERQVIQDALRQHRFQIGDTAQHLGITRKNLWEKMKKLGIERD